MIPEVVIEAGARALRVAQLDGVARPGFAEIEWDIGGADRKTPLKLARAAITAAAPLLLERDKIALYLGTAFSPDPAAFVAGWQSTPPDHPVKLPWLQLADGLRSHLLEGSTR